MKGGYIMPMCKCGNKADFLVSPNEEVHSYLSEGYKEPLCKNCLDKFIDSKGATDVYDIDGKYIQTECSHR